MASITGGLGEGVAGVQSTMKSERTRDLIALRETKSIVHVVSWVTHFPILPEASLFSNMSRRGYDVGTLILLPSPPRRPFFPFLFFEIKGRSTATSYKKKKHSYITRRSEHHHQKQHT